MTNRKLVRSLFTKFNCVNYGSSSLQIATKYQKCWTKQLDLLLLKPVSKYTIKKYTEKFELWHRGVRATMRLKKLIRHFS